MHVNPPTLPSYPNKPLPTTRHFCFNTFDRCPLREQRVREKGKNGRLVGDCMGGGKKGNDGLMYRMGYTEQQEWVWSLSSTLGRE